MSTFLLIMDMLRVLLDAKILLGFDKTVTVTGAVVVDPLTYARNWVFPIAVS
jgi:hypothetical protein